MITLREAKNVHNLTFILNKSDYFKEKHNQIKDEKLLNICYLILYNIQSPPFFFKLKFCLQRRKKKTRNLKSKLDGLGSNNTYFV